LRHEAAQRAALRAAFAACDAGAYQALGATGDRSGACALAALVSSKHIWVANCGDCRAVLVRRAGAAALSKDHRPDAPSERARMAPLAGAAATGKRGYFQGLAVSRSLGDFRTKMDHARAGAPPALPPLLPAALQTVTSEPEVAVAQRLASDELLILACDGVWDVLSSEEAAGLARAARAGGAATPQAIAAALIHEALERGSNDNLTAIVADLGGTAEAGAASV